MPGINWSQKSYSRIGVALIKYFVFAFSFLLVVLLIIVLVHCFGSMWKGTTSTIHLDFDWSLDQPRLKTSLDLTES